MANGLVLCDKTNSAHATDPILRPDHRGRRHDRPCRDPRDPCRDCRPCTELLTSGGWQPIPVHALLLTVCQMLREGEAKIQLKPDEQGMWPLKDYSEMEAREAYKRVAKYHGWPTQRRHA